MINSRDLKTLAERGEPDPYPASNTVGGGPDRDGERPGPGSGGRGPVITVDAPADQRDRWWVVVAAGLVVFMAQLDTSIVAVALPAIEVDLAVRTNVSEWIVLGYLLPVIALLLPSGRWVDQIGERSVLIFATVGFAITSVLAGAASKIVWLVAARVLQGCFAALLLALTPVLPTTAVRSEARGRAMGVVTTLGPLGAVSGPVLGGLLVEVAGWPWIFYVNVPVSIAVIAIALRHMEPGGRLRRPDRTWATESLLLAVASTVLFVSLSFTASQGGAWGLLALLALPPLLAWQRMRSTRVVRDLLRLPGMPQPHVALLAVFAAMSVVLFLAPFHLQRELQVSAAVTGVALLSFPIAMAVLGLISGVLADRWGSRPTALTGATVVCAGLVLMPLGSATTVVSVVLRLAVIGVGVGLFNASDMTLAMSLAPRPLVGTAAATTSTARQLGLALGPALATTCWALSGYDLAGIRVAGFAAAGLALAGVMTLVCATSAGPTQ